MNLTILKWIYSQYLKLYTKVYIFKSYLKLNKNRLVKNDPNIESNYLKVDTPNIYTPVVSWLVGGLLMSKIFYHV